MPYSITKDLAKFLGELGRETDRGLPLVAAAYIDHSLSESLRAFFCEGPSTAKLLDESNSPLGTFSARSEACLALGLIDEYEYSEIAIIRKVRNEFAHEKHGVTFSSSRVQGLCASLKSEIPTGPKVPKIDARFRFMNAAVKIVMHLYYRPAFVELERRKLKAWIPEGSLNWRSVANEGQPLEDAIVLMGSEILMAGPKKKDTTD